MRMMLSVFTAAAILGGATVAFAATPSTATGTIKSIDMTKHSMTLSNGSTYAVDKSVSLSDMKAGEKVTVTYTKTGSTMDASAIKPAV
jgi:Cu/Ag efflux protein CusF